MPALIMVVFYRWQCKDVAASLMTPVVAPSVRAVSSLTLVRARLISPVIGCGRLGAPSLVSSKVGAVKVLSTLACMEFFPFDARIRKWSTSSPYKIVSHFGHELKQHLSLLHLFTSSKFGVTFHIINFFVMGMAF